MPPQVADGEPSLENWAHYPRVEVEDFHVGGVGHFGFFCHRLGYGFAEIVNVF